MRIARFCRLLHFYSTCYHLFFDLHDAQPAPGDHLQSDRKNDRKSSLASLKYGQLARSEEEHETELTRLAEQAVEKGVNEIQKGTGSRDDDFKVKKGEAASEAQRKKNTARKKKKSQRQNRKTGRK
jgi:hypothetical protein